MLAKLSSLTTHPVGKTVGEAGMVYVAVGNAKWYPPTEGNLAIPEKKVRLPFDPKIPLVGTSPEKYIFTMTCPRLFIVTLFVIAVYNYLSACPQATSYINHRTDR